jgi:serine/threonine-protein kinase
MVTTASNDDSNLVAQVVAEWRERLLQGEHFEVTEYISKYPTIADELRDLFPAVARIEDLKGDVGNLTCSVGAGASLPEGVTLERLGDFRILREVGRGGMGIVYEAEQESLGRHVALKVLPAQAILEPQKQRRFQREAKAAARMHHTNIVPVYGVGEHEGMFYYVMQFIQGLGLDEVLVELKNLHQARNGSKGSGASPTHRESVARGKDMSAADVAHSLLTGQFARPPEAIGDGANGAEVKPWAITATLTAGPEGEAPSHPTRPAGAGSPGRPVQPVGAPPGKPAVVSPSPSAVASSVVRSEQGDKSTLTESGRHYWRSVARIGIQVAEALDYAHGQGILHRDIKPSNLLLDLQGTVWVTDFGLAKATSEGDDLTHTGDIVGTLRYMSPERFNGISDSRGDIYSIGLTLYELIVEQPAFEETDRGKLIKKVTNTTPPRPRKINPAIPRDLETIVLKAIEREPARRYATARALAEDLKRFVDDKPIQARQASQAERLWRWCRRNPVVAGLSAAVLTLLVAVAVGSTVVALRFEKMANEESRLRDKENKLRLLADEARSKAEDARKEAENNLEEARRQKKLAEENFHKARMAVDDSLTRISESKLLDVAGLQPLRKELLDSALKYYQGFLEQRSDDPVVQKDLATAYTRVARITAEISSKEKAIEAYRQAITMRKKLLEREPENLEVQSEIAYHHQAIGRLQRQLGNPDAALKSLQEASTILRGVIPKSREKDELLNAFANVNNDIGVLYVLKNEPLEAMSYYTAALKLQRQLVQENPKHPKLVRFQFELANQLNEMGRLHRDIGLFRDASKLHGEALALLKELVAAHTQHELGNDLQRALAGSQESLGDVESRNGQPAAALKAYREALPIRERLANTNPSVTDYQSDLAHAYFTLGLLQAKTGQTDEAVNSYRRAIERQRLVVVVAPLSAAYPRLLGLEYVHLGKAQRQLGQRDEALHSYQEARAILEKLPQPAAGDLYELACVRAACALLTSQTKEKPAPQDQAQRQQDADLALEMLQKAVAAGFRDLERVEKDTELDGLRALPAFKQVLSDLRARVKVLVWNPDLEAAKAQAVREKKDLFVYFTGSDWCGWCLLVRKDVFGKDAFIDYVPRHFVLVELDFPQHKARPKNYLQNRDLLERWGLKGFPSLILADAQGRPYANLRDGKVRDDAAAYVQRMEELRKVRVDRDELLAQAAGLEGVEKAKIMDKALSLLPADFRGDYHEIVAQIRALDSQDQAGLHSKYLPLVVGKRRIDVQETMRKQDWDGTILKIDKIIEELKPTGDLAAKFYVDRARAHAKLGRRDKSEADYTRAVEIKPDDADLRIERGQFYEKNGQPDKAKVDYDTAIAAKVKQVADCRPAFDGAPHVQANRAALNSAYFALGQVQRSAGRPADAAATALERAKLWPGDCMELYNVACELALCVPLVGKDKEQRTPEQEALRRQYADQAMEALRTSVLLGWNDVAHMQKDTDLDALRGREDYKELERRLESPDAFAAANESRTLKGHTQAVIECVAVAPNSRQVLSAGYDNTVRLWDVESGKEICRFVGHKGMVHGLAFAADGKRVVTAGADGTVRLWDAETGKEIRAFTGHTGAVRSVALSPDGKQLLTGGQDKTLRLWELETGKEIRRLEGPTSMILSVGFTPDGRHAISGGSESVVYYVNVRTGKVARRLEVPQDKVLKVAVSRDGRKAIAGTMGGSVYVWDLENGRPLHRMEGHWSPVRGVAFTPDSRRTVSGNTRRGTILADAETGRELYRLGPTLPVGDLAITPDGRWIVTANADAKVHLWSLAEDVLGARDLAHRGEWAKAEVAYNQALERHPKDVDLRGERARFYACRQQWDRAIADFTEAIQARKGESDLILERGRCYAGSKQWDKAAHDFDRALSLLTDGSTGESDRSAVWNEIMQWDDLFDRVTKLRPKDRQPWLARLNHHAPRGQWKQAVAALARLVELTPEDHFGWYQLAPLQLELGDMEGYRRVCREMLKRFGETDQLETAERTAKTCLLIPNSGVDRGLPVKLAERAANRSAGQANAKWFHLAKGIADYREGQFPSALERLGKSLSPGSEVIYLDSMAYLFLAMAHQRLGQGEEAQQALYKARFLMNEHFPKLERGQFLGPDWADWLRFQIVRREAEALIKTPAAVSQK